MSKTLKIRGKELRQRFIGKIEEIGLKEGLADDNSEFTITLEQAEHLGMTAAEFSARMADKIQLKDFLYNVEDNQVEIVEHLVDKNGLAPMVKLLSEVAENIGKNADADILRGVCLTLSDSDLID